MTLWAFCLLLTWIEGAHLLADFFAQSNWMALGKSSHWRPLLTHVTVYALVLGLVLALRAMTLTDRPWLWLSSAPLTLYVGLNWLAHLGTDFVTSRINKKLLTATPGDRHWFFFGVGTDQLIHRLTLLWTAYALLVA